MNRLSSRVFFFFMLFALFIPRSGSAAEADGQGVPAELAPWADWIRQKHPEWGCASSGGYFQCVWPGLAEYKLSESGASFSLHVELLAAWRLALPSGSSLFPRDIKVVREGGGAVEAPLEHENGKVFLRLPKGRFVVSGNFAWDRIPPELPAPGEYGLVQVATGDADLSRAIRRDKNSLRLETEDPARSAESVSLSVVRGVFDGSPLRLDTRLRLKVSGRARSVQFDKALPNGAVPVSVVSPVPFALSQEGALALQVSPGEYEVSILAVMPQPVSEIALEPVSSFWPAEETWSLAQDSRFRTVEVAGAEALNADFARLPPEWTGSDKGAAYLVKLPAKVELREIRRGEVLPPPNDIRLEREFWIDLDGSGFTVVDSFTGALNREFRLNALPETQVGRAMADGAPAFISKDPASGASGIELRRQDLRLETVSRIENERAPSAVGWNAQVSSLEASLNLPPSWQLIHAVGAGKVPSGWLDSWSLLDLFVAILLAAAAFKLWGVVASILIGAALILNHGEFLAPRMFLIHLMILSVWRLLTAERESVWSSLCRGLLLITFCAWALQGLAFSKLQLTQFLFPQLQAGTRYRTFLQQFLFAFESSLLVWPLLLASLAAMFLVLRWISKSVSSSSFRVVGRAVVGAAGIILLLGLSSSLIVPRVMLGGLHSYEVAKERRSPSELRKLRELRKQAPSRYEGGGDYAQEPSHPKTVMTMENKALVSGPAIPDWEWRSHYFSVPGPVSPGHRIRFFLLPPKVVRVVCGLRALLILVVIALVFRKLGYRSPVLSSSKAGTVAAAIAMLLFFCGSGARAEMPGPELLGELETRLSKQVCQRDECAIVKEARIEIAGNELKIALKVASDGLAAAPLPGPLDSFAPRVVTLNNKETTALRRNANNFLEVRTIDKENAVEAKGPLPSREPFTIQFSQTPLFVSVSAPGWLVEGLSPSGHVEKGLRFTRKSQEEARNAILKQNSLPSWTILKRSIEIGDQIGISSVVRRIGSIESSFHVSIPLLEGERVTTGKATVENGRILLGFPAGEREISYSSTMPFTPKLVLKAQSIPGVSETWQASCAPFIECTPGGIAPSYSIIDGERAFLWQPFPGEEAIVASAVLSGVEGDFVTIDSAAHSLRWGSSLLEGKLDLDVRATRQAALKIKVPPGAQVSKTLLDGNSWTTAAEQGESSILLAPGRHSVSLDYESPWSPGFFEAAPELNLNVAANNLRVEVSPSPDRWILWTGGLPWGPCVLFWSKMIFIALFCVALARLKFLPLSQASAALLGLGLATLPVVWIFAPLGWLAGLRALENPHEKWQNLKKPLRIGTICMVTAIALAVLYWLVEAGLELKPPMLVVGNNSTSSTLKWFTDHSASPLPRPWVVSLPLWCWRTFAFAWSAWLAVELLFSWLKLTVDRLKEAAA